MLKKCPVCGKEFEAKGNIKFCSDACKIKGKAAARKAWEQKTGYKDSERFKRREQRQQKRTAENEKIRKESAERIARQEKEAKAAEEEEKKELLSLAAAGDPIARMEIALETGGKLSADYWSAFKEYEIAQAESSGLKKITVVNGIAVTDPEFTEKILDALAIQGGAIMTRVEHTADSYKTA